MGLQSSIRGTAASSLPARIPEKRQRQQDSAQTTPCPPNPQGMLLQLPLFMWSGPSSSMQEACAPA